jgi:hypothetical protein
VAGRRVLERHERGGAGRAAPDPERAAELRAGRLPEAWVRARPLDLGVPVLRVDTTAGYAPAFEEVVAFARAAGAAAG